MVVDARFDVLKPVRSQMGLVLMESYWITDLPQRLWQGVASQFGSRTELVAENEKLKTENLLLQGRMQKLAALTEQNVRLRELLNSSALVNEKVEVAELIGMDPNPFTHRIIIKVTSVTHIGRIPCLAANLIIQHIGNQRIRHFVAIGEWLSLRLCNA